MKHMLKKSLAVLLAMLMLLGAMAVGAAADAAPGTEEASVPGQAEVIEEDNAVQAEEEAPKKLVAPKTEITITVGDYVSMEALLNGTTWELKELRVIAKFWGDKVELDWDKDANSFVQHVKGFTGVKGGSVILYITAPNREEVHISVKVKHTFKSWIQGLYEGVKLFVFVTVVAPIVYLLQFFGWYP